MPCPCQRIDGAQEMSAPGVSRREALPESGSRCDPAGGLVGRDQGREVVDYDAHRTHRKVHE